MNSSLTFRRVIISPAMAGSFESRIGSLSAACRKWQSLSRLFSCPLPKSHSRSSPILIDEIDAGTFEGAPDYFKRGTPGLARPGLHLVHSHNPKTRFICEILLAPWHISWLVLLIRLCVNPEIYKFREKLNPKSSVYPH